MRTNQDYRRIGTQWKANVKEWRLSRVRTRESLHSLTSAEPQPESRPLAFSAGNDVDELGCADDQPADLTVSQRVPHLLGGKRELTQLVL